MKTPPTPKDIELVAEHVLKMLQEEIINQGHKDTSKLLKSLQYDIIYKSNAIEIIFSYIFYGRFVNDGVPASKVNYPIQIMIDYLKRKGVIKSKKDEGIAYAVRAKHKKEGIPTKASLKFSKNGRRTGFQDHVISQIPSKVQPLIDSQIIEPLQMWFFDVLKQIKI